MCIVSTIHYISKQINLGTKYFKPVYIIFAVILEILTKPKFPFHVQHPPSTYITVVKSYLEENVFQILPQIAGIISYLSQEVPVFIYVYYKDEITHYHDRLWQI